MKMFFISLEMYPNRIGGEEIFNYYLIEELKKYYQITLITHHPVSDKNTHSFIPLKFKPVSFTFSFQILFYIIFSSKPDLIIVSYSDASWINWFIYPILNKILGLNYVIFIHTGSFQEWNPYFAFNMFFKRSSKIIAVSHRACEEYEKRSGKKVIYIPPIIPFEKSGRRIQDIKGKIGIPINSRVLIYVGSLKKMKGVETIINAFIDIDLTFILTYNLYLILAGEGEMRKELEQKASQSSVHNRIIFLGNIYRNEIPDLFKIGDIYIIASHYENLSVSMLEAMFNSKPIIATNAMGIRDVLENNKDALFFEIDNLKELKNRIEMLVQNKNLAIRLANKAYEKYVLHYNFENTVEKIRKIIEP
jgi:glycosyltransferase involved in cell wall biosynthesis